VRSVQVGAQFGSVAVATPPVQNVMRRSRARSTGKISRDSAGFWQRLPSAPEPETAGFGPGSRRRSNLSLLVSWAVRIRFRFAY
jgi:hypothetical protein